MSRSIRIRKDYIEKAKLAVKYNQYRTQRELAEDCGLALSTVNNFLTGRSVDYTTFIEICEKLRLDSNTVADLSNHVSFSSIKMNLETIKVNSYQDWGTFIDVSVFYDRTAELSTLQQWIIDERCRVVALLGMGGIGKTALSIKLAKQIQPKFDYLIWRSLRNAPLVQNILADLLQFFSNDQKADLPKTFDEQLSQLVSYLRTSRCLLIFDNAEFILQSGTRLGSYRSEYEEYCQLLKCVGETYHNSCLILTLRELPKELIFSAGENLPVRCFNLTGLPVAEGRKIFQTKGSFIGSDAEWSVLINHYAGNPLALMIVASTIKTFFEGNISIFLQFLEQNLFIIDELRDLLQEQFQRLTHLEQEIMYWLALNLESISSKELQENFIHSIAPGQLLGAITSLQRRSLIEQTAIGFIQKPLVIEYVLDKLIEQITQELVEQKFTLFNSYALIKITTKSYIQENQARLILQPIINKLIAKLGSFSNLKNCLIKNLSMLQKKSFQEIGYARENILNLLRYVQIDVTVL